MRIPIKCNLPKMLLLSPVCYILLWVLLSEGTASEKRLIQLRRGKRDMDILAACDEKCVPEDQITDYDMILEYDDEDQPSSDSSGDKKTPCVYACRIVDMNKTEGTLDSSVVDFSIVAIEDLGNNIEAPSDSPSDYLTLKSIDEKSTSLMFSPTTMMSTQQLIAASNNVSGNATIRMELENNVTEKQENATTNSSTKCACSQNSTSPTVNVASTTQSLETENVTESVTNNLTTSSMGLTDFQPELTKINSSEADVLKDQNKSTIDKTTTLLPSFTPIPVIPKVIRLTVIEAEMGEPGVTGTSSIKTTKVQTLSTSSGALNGSTYSSIEQDLIAEELRNRSIIPSIDESPLKTMSSHNAIDTTTQLAKALNLPSKNLTIGHQTDKSVSSFPFKIGSQPFTDLQVSVHGATPSNDATSITLLTASQPPIIASDVTVEALDNSPSLIEIVKVNQSSEEEEQKVTNVTDYRVTKPENILSQEQTTIYQKDTSSASVTPSNDPQIANNLQLNLLSLLSQLAILLPTTTSVPVTTTAFNVAIENHDHSLISTEMNNVNKISEGQDYKNTFTTANQVTTPQNVPSTEKTSSQNVDAALVTEPPTTKSLSKPQAEPQQSSSSESSSEITLTSTYGTTNIQSQQTKSNESTSSSLMLETTGATTTTLISSTDSSTLKSNTNQTLTNESVIPETIQSSLNHSIEQIENKALVALENYSKTIKESNLTTQVDNCASLNLTGESCKKFEDSKLERSNHTFINKSYILMEEKNNTDDNSYSSLDNNTDLANDAKSSVEGKNNTEQIKLASDNSSQIIQTDSENENITLSNLPGGLNDTVFLGKELKNASRVVNQNESQPSINESYSRNHSIFSNTTTTLDSNNLNDTNLTSLSMSSNTLKNDTNLTSLLASSNNLKNDTNLTSLLASSNNLKNDTNLTSSSALSVKHEPVLNVIDLENLKENQTSNSNATVDMTSSSLQLQNATLLQNLTKMVNGTNPLANKTTTLRKI